MPEECEKPGLGARRSADAWSAGTVTVAILAGGLGTRLRSVVADRPKVMADVGGRPFLAWWLDALDRQGFSEVVLCTGHLGGQIRDAFGDSYGGLRLKYSEETRPLGTGGALKSCLKLIQTPDVLVLNGDSFCDVDLRAFYEAHASRRSSRSLILARVEDTQRFGRVERQADGRVTEFVEKSGAHGPGWINAGIYAFGRDVLAALPLLQPLSLEREVLPASIEDGLYGFSCDGAFLDIGIPEALASAAEFFQSVARRQAALVRVTA